ncbi:MAG: twin-arginine translocase subunit TatC, partial [Fimbriimonadales bacterium]|nr:twin-arginine translocase subunit TatC [Fimbriimonadales bacterium]
RVLGRPLFLTRHEPSPVLWFDLSIDFWIVLWFDLLIVPLFDLWIVLWFVSYLEDFQGAALYQQPGAFAVFILKMVLAFGVGFQMPVIVWFLARVELLSSESLLRNWRIAVVVIVAISAFLTPSGDFFSLAMMSTPLVVLYFGGIVAARITERRRLKGR